MTTHFGYGITPLYNELEQLFSTIESLTDVPTIVLHNESKKIFSCELVAWDKNCKSYMPPFSCEIQTNRISWIQIVRKM